MKEADSLGFNLAMLIGFMLGNFFLSGVVIAIFFFLMPFGLFSTLVLVGVGIFTGWLALSVMLRFKTREKQIVLDGVFSPIPVLFLIMGGGLLIARTNPLLPGAELSSQTLFPKFNIPIVLFVSLIYYAAFNSAIVKELVVQKKTKEMIWYSIGIVVYGAMFIVSYFFSQNAFT